MFVLSSDGKLLSSTGVKDISRKGIEAVKRWTQGESLPPPTTDEFEGDNVWCDGCTLNTIIALRYHYLTCDNSNLCSAFQKKGHQLVPQSTQDE